MENMEDRLNQMNAVLQSMQKTLECNICLDLMNKPLTTKCGHSFCQDCIYQLLKTSRATAPCPLCMSNVTRRSLGKNGKIAGLVSAVRDIIVSIKKDCCFEVTPSKYRPRRQALIPCPEDDDSENEENDEPRRGLRSRAVTTPYNAEVHVPKPRARSAKQRILASGSGQELNLYMDGKTDMTASTETSLHTDLGLASYISHEHSYSSPTKQEPQERSGAPQVKGQLSRGQSNRGRGKITPAARGKARVLASKPVKSSAKIVQTYERKESSDDHLSLSQQADSKMEFNDGVLNSVSGPSKSFGTTLEHEKPTDKVTKWLNTSSEVGFRIGLKNSSESASMDESESLETFRVGSEIKAVSDNQSLLLVRRLEDDECVGITSGTKISDRNKNVTSLAPSVSGRENKSLHASEPKFFKAKMKNDSSVNNIERSPVNVPRKNVSEQEIQKEESGMPSMGTPDDPYKFIPSQKTPKQKTQPKRGRVVKSNARGALNVSRGRVRGRGRGRGGVELSSNAQELRRESVADFGLLSSKVSQTHSTPAFKGKTGMHDIDLSLIQSADITVVHGDVKESVIVCQRDDDDDNFHDIPDSCPVNTKDEFDMIVSEVKAKGANLSEKNVEDQVDDEKELDLLFVTPAQASEVIETKDKNGVDANAPKINNDMREIEKKVSQTSAKTSQRKYSRKKQTVDKSAARKSTKLSNSKSSASKSDDSSRESTKSQNSGMAAKSKKAKEEVEALCALFNEVDEHPLSTVSLHEEELEKKDKEKHKDNAMRHNISLHNQTLENTVLNKTIPTLLPEADESMPPPKASSRNRKVKFLHEAAKDANICNNTIGNPTGVAASSGTKGSGSRIYEKDSKIGKPVKSNLRYGSELKQKLLEPNKVVPMSVSIKNTKSPGWSHVAGARKDLKTRHTSLNITGGEQRGMNDSKTEGGTSILSSHVPSSSETNMIIDEQTQDLDVEYLQCSQSKIELVKKLKKIVKQIKKVDGIDGDMMEACETEIPDVIKKEISGNQVEENDKCNSSSIKEKGKDCDPQKNKLMGCSKNLEPSNQKLPSKGLEGNKDINTTVIKEYSTIQESHQNPSTLQYSAETEPFDCSELRTEAALGEKTSSNSTSRGLSKKRKVAAVLENDDDSQLSKSSRPSKLTRKTFAISAKSGHDSTEKLGSSTDSECKEGVIIGADVLPSESPKISQSENDAPPGFSPHLDKSKDVVTTLVTDTKLNSNTVVEAVESFVKTIPPTDDLSLQSLKTPEDKPRPPHHRMSLSTDTASQSDSMKGNSLESTLLPVGYKEGNCSSQSVPFKSMGALCNKSARCVSTCNSSPGIESCGCLGRDLCRHSIPCEVYQVLMKYMNVLSSQQQQQSGCCCNSQYKGAVGMVPETDGALPKTTCIDNVVNSNHSETKESTDVGITTDMDDMEAEECVKDPFENEISVPNSCNTEEFEMAIPLPLMDIGLRSVTLKGSDETRELPKRVTRYRKAGPLKSSIPSSGAQLLKEKTASKPSSDAQLLEEKPASKVKTFNNVSIQCKRDGSSQNLEMNMDENLTETKQRVSSRLESRQSSQTKNQMSSKKIISSDLVGTLSQEISLVNKNLGKNNPLLGVDRSTKVSNEIQINNDLLQFGDDVLNSSCEFGSSQQSTSLLSAADMSNIKQSQFVSNTYSFGPEMKDISDPKSEEKSSKLDKMQQVQKKNVSVKTITETVDVEKENLKNQSNMQMSLNRPKRKPLQSGIPDLENIMSQVVKDGKIDASHLNSQLSQISNKISSQKSISNKSSVLNTDVPANRSLKVTNLLIDNVNMNVSDLEDLENEDSFRNANESTQRKFRRIKRPASSSSSEDSDCESNPKMQKRRLRVKSSGSGSSVSSKVAKIEEIKEPEQPEYILDSEEMRDMERLDKNVWAFFGDSYKDSKENLTKNQLSPKLKEKALEIGDFDLIPSDEEIPSTADVMRNVELDMTRVYKKRQEEMEMQNTVDLISQDTGKTDIVSGPSLSTNTRNLFNKVDKSLSVAENLLDGEDSLFQGVCTPVVEEKKSGEKPAANSKKSGRSVPHDRNTTKADSEPLVISDSEGEADNVSHSSAYSSQSECINTQKQKQIQDEVERLKARVRELEAEKKGKPSKSKGLETKTAKASPSKARESDEELFSSLPDFNASTEPSLPPSIKPVNTLQIAKPASVPLRQACRMVCTGLNASEMNKVNSFAKDVAPAGSAFFKSWCTGITHVIVKTDKDKLAQRTLKYLFGVASGCWVISLQWILDSMSSNKFLPEDEYEVFDCTGTPGPRRGRTYFKSIFEDCEFFLKPPFIEVSIEQLKDLLELCGARLVNSPSAFSSNKSSLKVIVVQTDSEHDPESYQKKYGKISISHDWIIECVGMHSHVCINPYIIGKPSHSHIESSGIPASLMEETQDLTCSQDP